MLSPLSTANQAADLYAEAREEVQFMAQYGMPVTYWQNPGFLIPPEQGPLHSATACYVGQTVYRRCELGQHWHTGTDYLTQEPLLLLTPRLRLWRHCCHAHFQMAEAMQSGVDRWS